MIRCKICDNERENQVHKVHEMMYTLASDLKYLECALCGCIQLVTIPEDIGKYYPEGYYSFADGTTWKFGFRRRLYCLYG